MRIALCLIATGEYWRFVPPCIESARKNFCFGESVQVHVFSDKEVTGPCVRCWNSAHRAWPSPTLYRYHTILEAKTELVRLDYVFYLDVDTRFVAPVRAEICGGLTATLHPGYFGKPRTSYSYENRLDSRACVRADEGTRYYCGAFQGGGAQNWVSAMEEMASRIDDDASRGVTAIWHDESHWNRYLIDHPPDVALPPTYCCPETWPMEGRKILALDKNHGALRK